MLFSDQLNCLVTIEIAYTLTNISGLQLLSEQSKTQDTSCLPALKVSDIEPTIPHISVQMGAAGKQDHTHAKCILHKTIKCIF